MRDFDRTTSGAGVRHSRNLAEVLRGLFRAGLLFGAIAVALAMIVLPVAEKHARQVMADHVEGLDQMTTGSIGDRQTSPFDRASEADRDGGPCLLFPDGSQRGACGT